MTARVVLIFWLTAFPIQFAIPIALAAEPDDRSPWPTWRAVSVGVCPAYSLLRSDDAGAACWPPGLRVTALDETKGDEASTYRPAPPAEAKEPRWLLAAAVAFAEVAVTAGKAIITEDRTSFNVVDEGWFGPDTKFGGADKASHFADYYVITKEFTLIFGRLGFSENAARLMAAGTAFTGGLVNEVADGFTKYGFSYQGWGTTLHFAADNLRFPFTAVGFRYDLNHRKWHGPNTGNFP